MSFCGRVRDAIQSVIKHGAGGGGGSSSEGRGLWTKGGCNGPGQTPGGESADQPAETRLGSGSGMVEAVVLRMVSACCNNH